MVATGLQMGNFGVIKRPLSKCCQLEEIGNSKREGSAKDRLWCDFVRSCLCGQKGAHYSDFQFYQYSGLVNITRGRNPLKGR